MNLSLVECQGEMRSGLFGGRGQYRGVPGLVEAQLAAAGQLDPGEDAPALILRLRARDAFGSQLLDLCLNVVANEVELMGAILIGVVKAGFQRRQGEEEPVVAGVHVGKLQNVAEEVAIGDPILGKNDNMGAIDHDFAPFRYDYGMIPAFRD